MSIFNALIDLTHSAGRQDQGTEDERCSVEALVTQSLVGSEVDPEVGHDPLPHVRIHLSLIFTARLQP